MTSSDTGPGEPRPSVLSLPRRVVEEIAAQPPDELTERLAVTALRWMDRAEEAALSSIEARNAGIDMAAVRAIGRFGEGS